MLVPDAKHTLRVVVPRQLLTTMSYTEAFLADDGRRGESGGAGLIARVQVASVPLGDASQVSPPGPEKSTIDVPKLEYVASRSYSVAPRGEADSAPARADAETWSDWAGM